jgi:hypothetical protein
MQFALSDSSSGGGQGSTFGGAKTASGTMGSAHSEATNYTRVDEQLTSVSDYSVSAIADMSFTMGQSWSDLASASTMQAGGNVGSSYSDNGTTYSNGTSGRYSEGQSFTSSTGSVSFTRFESYLIVIGNWSELDQDSMSGTSQSDSYLAASYGLLSSGTFGISESSNGALQTLNELVETIAWSGGTYTSTIATESIGATTNASSSSGGYSGSEVYGQTTGSGSSIWITIVTVDGSSSTTTSSSGTSSSDEITTAARPWKSTAPATGSPSRQAVRQRIHRRAKTRPPGLAPSWVRSRRAPRSCKTTPPSRRQMLRPFKPPRWRRSRKSALPVNRPRSSAAVNWNT